MKVLSLFDGIACGYEALSRTKIKIDEYYASEIELSSIKIATYNHPDIVEVGDITNLYYKNGVLYNKDKKYNVGHIDLIIGGSPCTDFSSIGYAKGMKSGQAEITTLSQYLDLKKQGSKFDGQSYLFWEYLRLLQEVRPKYYLLENVVMAKKWQKIIDDNLNTSPIMINSSLLSAQNRPRLYWTNLNVKEPNDKNIILDNILDKDDSRVDISHCKTVKRSYQRLIDKYGYIPKRFNAYNASEIKDKACALSRGSMVTSSCATLLFERVENGVHIVKNGILNDKYQTKLQDGKYNLRRLNIKEMERLQTLPDNYTKVEGVGVSKRSQAIGNAWTVDVIAYILNNIKEEELN